MAPSEDDPQPVTEEEYAERDQLLKAGSIPVSVTPCSEKSAL